MSFMLILWEQTGIRNLKVDYVTLKITSKRQRQRYFNLPSDRKKSQNNKIHLI